MNSNSGGCQIISEMRVLRCTKASEIEFSKIVLFEFSALAIKLFNYINNNFDKSREEGENIIRKIKKHAQI